MVERGILRRGPLGTGSLGWERKGWFITLLAGESQAHRAQGGFFLERGSGSGCRTDCFVAAGAEILQSAEWAFR